MQEQHRAGRVPQAGMTAVVRDRRPDVGRQRQPLVASALAADQDLPGPPVDVADVGGGGFPGPQPSRASSIRIA